MSNENTDLLLDEQDKARSFLGEVINRKIERYLYYKELSLINIRYNIITRKVRLTRHLKQRKKRRKV